MAQKEIISKQIVGHDIVKLSGILEDGYGIVATRAMHDTRLTIEAKAIYANLCCYASKNDHTSYPSVENQCRELGISENRYLKHRKLLVKYGYITITKRREKVLYADGTSKEFATKNLYTIVMCNPVEVEVDGVNDKKVVSKEVIPLHRQNKGVEKLRVENCRSNNTNINNTNINNNNKKDIYSSNEQKEKKTTPVKHKHGEYENVRLTDEELNKLIAKYGDVKTQQAIKKLDEYIEMSGKKYKSCYLAMLTWVYKSLDQDNKPKQQSNNRFNNFNQRQYTRDQYQTMEQELLNRQDHPSQQSNVKHGNVLDNL